MASLKMADRAETCSNKFNNKRRCDTRCTVLPTLLVLILMSLYFNRTILMSALPRKAVSIHHGCSTTI